MTVLQTHWLKLSVHAFCFSIMACSPAVLTSAKEEKGFQVAVQELHRMLPKRAKGDRSKNSEIKMHVLEIVRSLQTCCDLMYVSVHALADDEATVKTLQRHGNEAYDLVRGNRLVDYGNYPYSVLLKMICMTDSDICLAIRHMARRIPTLKGVQLDTQDALLNQGNVIETIMTCDYPLDEASRNPEQLYRMRQCICKIANAIHYIYALSRGLPETKTGLTISTDSDLDRSKLQFILESSHNFAAVLIGVCNSALVIEQEQILIL